MRWTTIAIASLCMGCPFVSEGAPAETDGDTGSGSTSSLDASTTATTTTATTTTTGATASGSASTTTSPADTSSAGETGDASTSSTGDASTETTGDASTSSTGDASTGEDGCVPLGVCVEGCNCDGVSCIVDDAQAYCSAVHADCVNGACEVGECIPRLGCFDPCPCEPGAQCVDFLGHAVCMWPAP